ncbi:C1 family peptidase [Methanobrevibacter sp.]|uniref:C1 family peptidase n=1 Tax=Methanobrevibacter sp. TaxID=66852 RepID=UPI00388EE398
MKKIKILLVLTVLFISISAVSAEGNFTALQDEINLSTECVEITQDYVYNNETDANISYGITIEKNDFTINGNGHTIDGNGQTRIFNIRGNNVTIKNLNIINGKAVYGGGIFINRGIELTTNNVTFENNNASEFGGAILNLGEYESINDKFTNNYCVKGAAIYSQGETNIKNGTFTSDIELKWGFINIFACSLFIENTTFANATSKYSTAINSVQGKIKIKKSDFYNLTAIMTAGSIGVKLLFDEVEIENSNFINTCSGKNGGAIFADVGGEKGEGNGTIKIMNSQFINCSSEFGGAYLQLAGKLVIDNTNFTLNKAAFDGGSIYTSWTNQVNISNSRFFSNSGLYENFSNGGACYFDLGKIIIDSCTFENNEASEGSSIYAYDCKIDLSKNYFNNPAESGVSIYTVYDKSYTERGNNFTNDELSLNNTNYELTVESSQMKFDLINNTINVVTLPKRFDLRDWGWVSPVKNQGSMGACWAFGVTAALESSLIRFTNITYDFSENNLQNTMLKYSKYGEEIFDEGGNVILAANYYSSWLGVSPTEFDTYDELGKISPLIATPQDLHMKDMLFISERKNSTDNNGIKEAILKYGGIAVNYFHDNQYLNTTTYGYYNNKNITMNHVVCAVGWDDDYPASYFPTTAPGNGAFIIKNSWGTEFGDDGYFYISYYDVSFCTVFESMGFILKNTEDYDKLYQHEISTNYKTKNSTYFMNKYVAKENELIAAVGTIFNNNPYEISIFINGENVYNQSGISDYYGYSTINLNKCIPIKMGDEFSVMIKSNSMYMSTIRGHVEPNVTFVSDDGNNWTDLSENNESAIIKVYTKNLPFYTEDLVKIYKNDSQFTAEIGVANEAVTFEINGVTYTRTSDENGTATIAINLEPGNYSIKTTFNGTTVENTITVLPTLIAENLVKYFRNASQFYIDLIDGKGNPVSGINIIMNINGVFYNRTTNENGTARLNINLNPGEYILTAIDPLTGLMMSYNITVLPTMNATDMKMTYKDGSTFNVTVLDGQGKPLDKAAVTFNINGVLYIRYTDSQGIAKLNINLMAGEYIITSEYDGMKIANTITIKD